MIVYWDKVYYVGWVMVSKLKELIFCYQFKVFIQVAIGVKVIVSEYIFVLCKDVLVKCYGGDIFCKKKLL